MESLLTQLADELLIQDITEPSAILGSLSDDELQAAYDHVLEQFALELLIGADKNSEWSEWQARHRRQPRPHPFAASCVLCCAARSAATEAGKVGSAPIHRSENRG